MFFVDILINIDIGRTRQLALLNTESLFLNLKEYMLMADNLLLGCVSRWRLERAHLCFHSALRWE